MGFAVRLKSPPAGFEFLRRLACGLLVLCGFCFNGSVTASDKALKVFVLAGQSNMQGQGVVAMNHPQHYNGGKGNLVYVMNHSPQAQLYSHLRNVDGKWNTRDDVWVRYQTEHRGLLAGNLTIGFTGYGGTSHIGPELQLGHVVGDHFDAPVLLLKTAWGGKSLFTDFRPPSSGGLTGLCYKKILQEVDEALKNLKVDFPEYDQTRGFEITGFVWFQGWNDMIDEKAVAEYEANLVNLIKDVRKAWATPGLPVVIGELGNGGIDAGKNMLALRKAQAAAAAHPEFSGTVKFVSTTAFARPAEESPNTGHGHHWYGNAESYFLIGNAFGKTMVELCENSSDEQRTDCRIPRDVEKTGSVFKWFPDFDSKRVEVDEATSPIKRSKWTPYLFHDKHPCNGVLKDYPATGSKLTD